MYSPITAVALRTIRHNDRSSILTAWSPQLGRISLALPTGNGKESRRCRALTMPLGLFEGIIDDRQSREVMRIRDMKAWGISSGFPDVSSNPVRSTVAMFIAEVLGVITREGNPDPHLWNLIVETTYLLANGNSVALANAPIAFLSRLAYVAGIAPDHGDWKPNLGLDLVDGVFRFSRPMHNYWIDSREAKIITTLSSAFTGYSHISLLHLNRNIRNKILNGYLAYFSLHHYPLDRLKSLDILKVVFDG